MKDYILKDQLGEKTRDLKSLVYLYRFLKPHRRQFYTSIALLTLAAIVSLLAARSMGYFVDEGLTPRNWQASLIWAGVIIVLELISILVMWKGRNDLASCAVDTILEIRRGLFRHIHELPMSYYDREPLGRIMTRMTSDVEKIEEFFTGSMGRMVNFSIVFVVAMMAMLLTHFWLGLVMVLLMLPAVIYVMVTRKKVRHLNREMSRLSSESNARLAEYLNGIDIIRYFGLEKWATDKYQERIDQHQESLYTANTYYSWSRPITDFLCSLPLIVLMGLGGFLILRGQLEIAIFVVFIRYCERFSFPLAALTREIHVVLQAISGAERVTAFFENKRETDIFTSPLEPKVINQINRVEFVNVWMQYQTGNVVLKNISFSLEGADKIGLVGTTGSGKTSTLSLLTRLYPFQKGDLLINGSSIDSLDRHQLRERIGLVTQDVILFKGTLRENLTCGLSISDQDLLEFCQRAGIVKQFFSRGMNLDSEIQEKGANLSVGERQLIGLVRVLLKKPDLLILDEATSNIDAEMEELIHQTVFEQMKDRPCLFIAHRLSTLKACDRLLVFHNGEIVEQGSWEELTKAKSYFSQLQQSL